MESKEKKTITVQAKIKAPVDRVWKLWTTPEDIVKWNYASDDWQSPQAINDLREGGMFNIRMEAKDGSSGFDFAGVYDKVQTNRMIEYTLGDGRRVKIDFAGSGKKTRLVETFEAENVNSVDLQRNGWQSILNNFKKYAETRLH
jgi:uncharacterized protein YndB with AHSA1/START domain